MRKIISKMKFPVRLAIFTFISLAIIQIPIILAAPILKLDNKEFKRVVKRFDESSNMTITGNNTPKDFYSLPDGIKDNLIVYFMLDSLDGEDDGYKRNILVQYDTNIKKIFEGKSLNEGKYRIRLMTDAEIQEERKKNPNLISFQSDVEFEPIEFEIKEEDFTFDKPELECVFNIKENGILWNYVAEQKIKVDEFKQYLSAETEMKKHKSKDTLISYNGTIIDIKDLLTIAPLYSALGEDYRVLKDATEELKFGTSGEITIKFINNNIGVSNDYRNLDITEIKFSKDAKIIIPKGISFYNKLDDVLNNKTGYGEPDKIGSSMFTIFDIKTFGREPIRKTISYLAFEDKGSISFSFDNNEIEEIIYRVSQNEKSEAAILNR